MPVERLSEKFLDSLKYAANEEFNPMKYLSIDPGRSNGVCAYDARYSLIFVKTIASEDMVRFLDCFDNLDTCVYESYVVYPQKAKEHTYSDLETSRVIGRIEYWGELKRIKLIKQGAAVKKTGYLWLGQKPLPKSNPQNHIMDAHVHFTYWAVKTGRVNANQLIKQVTSRMES